MNSLGMDGIASISKMMQRQAEDAARRMEAEEAQALMPSLLSGDSTWIALKEAVDAFVSRVPPDHDVLVQVGDILMTNARFVEPHALVFEGYNEDGHQTAMVMHFSQVCARVVYRPKKGPERIVTGFSG